MSPPKVHPPIKHRPRLSRRALLTKQKMAQLAKSGAAAESVWIEMGRKMDEAYAEVVRSDDELRQAYRALSDTHEQLKRAQGQLIQSEKLASLGRLVAGVAHEINNPVSFVLGNAHAMQRYAARLKTYLEALHGDAPRQERARLRRELNIDALLADLDSVIEGTLEGAERTSRIVDALKRFSTADRDDDAPFDLADVVRRAADWVLRAAKTRMQVEYALPERLPTRGSAGQMHRVAVNLIQNAVDGTTATRDPRLRIAARIEAGAIVMRFHDNGPGIAAEYLERVFDPFFTTKPVGEGTGLGLSISYGIVERHGGSLVASNHSEGGAVLSLTLRLDTAAGEHAQRTS